MVYGKLAGEGACISYVAYTKPRHTKLHRGHYSTEYDGYCIVWDKKSSSRSQDYLFMKDGHSSPRLLKGDDPT